MTRLTHGLLVLALAHGFVPRAEAISPIGAGTLRDEQRLSPEEEAGLLRRRDPGESREQRAERLAAAEDRFRSAYLAAGRPRIAVYLNRALSDEVREWNVVAGVLEPQSATETTAKSDGTWQTVERESAGAKHLHLGPNDEQRREAGDESWTWRFEDGFLRPYLDTRCRVVDRASILRTTAAQSARTGGEYAGLAVKKVEMDALARSADVIVEILVRVSPESASGYDFRATAKEVGTGRILASVVTGDGGIRTQSTTRWVAGAGGYEKHTDPAKLPQIEEVAAGLGVMLMDSLSHAWE